MDQLVHVGMDLAWGARNKTGLAAVDERGALLASTTVRSDDEIVVWIEQHAPRPGVVAIDAPLIVANAEGSRPCERLIHTAFGRFDAGGYPSNTSNPHFDPPRALTLAHRMGLGIDPHGSSRERVAIEVYPHPAMVGLFELGRTLKYKRKKQGPELQLAETRRLLALMEGIAELRLEASDDWARIRRVVDGATSRGALGSVEDEIDGVFCGHLAWLWAQRSDALEVYGDVETGYIVAPPEPTWAPTPRLASVAASDITLTGGCGAPLTEDDLALRAALAAFVGSAPEAARQSPAWAHVVEVLQELDDRTPRAPRSSTSAAEAPTGPFDWLGP